MVISTHSATRTHVRALGCEGARDRTRAHARPHITSALERSWPPRGYRYTLPRACGVRGSPQYMPLPLVQAWLRLAARPGRCGYVLATLACGWPRPAARSGHVGPSLRSAERAVRISPGGSQTVAGTVPTANPLILLMAHRSKGDNFCHFLTQIASQTDNFCHRSAASQGSRRARLIRSKIRNPTHARTAARASEKNGTRVR